MMLAWGYLAAPLHAQSESDPKVSYLANFAKLIKWPDGTFDSRNPIDPFVVGVLGEDAFSGRFDPLKTVYVQNRLIRVVQLERTDLKGIQNCHLLWIGKSETEHLQDILAITTGKAILTVGDGPNFAQAGAILSFVEVNGMLRVNINVTTGKMSGLSIAKEILSVRHQLIR